MKPADSPITLLPIDPGVAPILVIPALIFFVTGLACVVAPGVLIKLQVLMLEWQRRVFGKFGVDWHLALVRHPAAVWVVRLMGLFFAAIGVVLLVSALAGMLTRPTA